MEDGYYYYCASHPKKVIHHLGYIFDRKKVHKNTQETMFEL